MNTALNTVQPGQQTPSAARPLRVAVGILGTAVLAMGAMMIYQGHSPAPVLQVAAVSTVPTTPAPESSRLQSTPSTAFARTGNTSLNDDMVEKSSPQAAKPAPVQAKKLVKPTPHPVPIAVPGMAKGAPVFAPLPAPVAVAATPVCGNCGYVESVTPIVRTTKTDGPGVGAVAGGVAGAVLGHQVGNGNGRTVATILGAIGGGFAGNAIERNLKKETVYQVGVHMEDGSRRTLEVGQAPTVGSKVIVDGSSIRNNDGGSYRTPAPLAQRTNQSSLNF